MLPRPPRPPRGDHDALSREDQVGHDVATGGIEDDRARRYRQLQVIAGLAVACANAGRDHRLRPEVVLVAIVDQHRLAHVHDEVDRATAAAVAAVGTTTRHVGLTPEGGGTVTAVAGDDGQVDAVEEHQLWQRRDRPVDR